MKQLAAAEFGRGEAEPELGEGTRGTVTGFDRPKNWVNSVMPLPLGWD